MTEGAVAAAPVVVAAGDFVSTGADVRSMREATSSGEGSAGFAANSDVALSRTSSRSSSRFMATYTSDGTAAPQKSLKKALL